MHQHISKKFYTATNSTTHGIGQLFFLISFETLWLLANSEKLTIFGYVRNLCGTRNRSSQRVEFSQKTVLFFHSTRKIVSLESFSPKIRTSIKKSSPITSRELEMQHISWKSVWNFQIIFFRSHFLLFPSVGFCVSLYFSFSKITYLQLSLLLLRSFHDFYLQQQFERQIKNTHRSNETNKNDCLMVERFTRVRLL